ncbi:MAG: PQQ-binding-like beta-propeller repeat protein [Verrucomicrobia bacterium]|nr:PQQ-binding-like beta-propeller repeat protein [Verrucomicrobiota bacterium]MBI3867337.1 PQQ-binding-like beta-propeller repeat protein [Verrucomicrobiota bacterium]
MSTPRSIRSFIPLLAFALALTASSADQPQWGQAWTRNQVSQERHLPESFDIETGRNVRWKARLGTESHSTPIVAGGRVYIGANNGEPRDPKHQGDRGVLMCFDEKSGAFLWQLVSPKMEDDPFLDWPKTGIASSVTVEGDRVYVVSNRGEVICLDARGLANGNDGPYISEARHMTLRGQPPLALGPSDADILWLFNMPAEVGIWNHDAAHSSILIQGDFLYVNTGTGVDNTHKKIRKPDAPSLIVLDKRTGKLIAKDDEHISPRIFHCTWSSPSFGKVGGRSVVFFAGGDGVVYGFEPVKPGAGREGPVALKRVFRFDPDPTGPKENVHFYNSNRREGPSNIYSFPVIDHDRLLFTSGGDLWWGKNEASLFCVRATGSGDVTGSAKIWSYPLVKHSLSSPAIHDGLVFIADCGRMVHCVDSRTGAACWSHEAKGDIWGSPLVADGKVYIGSRRGDFLIFAAAREKKLLFSTELDGPISATATAANGALYISTMFHLYALRVDHP